MPDDWVDWEWDETLFAGSAPYYARGRLPNAPGLADAFARALDLHGDGRLLDVGCGPGTVTLPLAHLFAEVVGLDADAGMIREAERLASEQGVTNARWFPGRAEELPGVVGDPPSFRVITFAASFHWLDRPRVAATVSEMLGPGGAVVHVDNRHQDSLGFDSALPRPPAGAIDELRRAYLGPDRRAGRTVRNTSPDDEDAVFRAAGFTGPEIVVVPDGRVVTRTVDDLVAETYSMSFNAPHLFGERLPAFDADLRALLTRSGRGGQFAVRLPDNRLMIWRPAAA